MKQDKSQHIFGGFIWPLAKAHHTHAFEFISQIFLNIKYVSHKLFKKTKISMQLL